MISPERLADYLDGALDTSERAAVEAELARDPGLREALGRMRRGDAALMQVRPPSPAEGFEERLRAALDGELADHLGAAATTDPDRGTRRDPEHVDELAARRTARLPRWWAPAAVGAAAAAVAGIALVAGGVLDRAADDTVETAEMFADDADEEFEVMEDAGGPSGAPIVLASDRELDDELVDELLDGPELTELAAAALRSEEGSQLARQWQGLLGVFQAETTLESAPADSDAAADDGPDEPATAGDAEVRVGTPPGERALTDPEAADVSRCLATVLSAEPDAIPAYVEIADYQREPALVIGLVTLDPATGAYTRPEAWVVARADCQTLRFSQG